MFIIFCKKNSGELQTCVMYYKHFLLQNLCHNKKLKTKYSIIISPFSTALFQCKGALVYSVVIYVSMLELNSEES